MTEIVNETAKSPRRSLPKWIDRIRQNPVVLKELRGRMRGGRAYVILTVYLLLLSGASSVVYLGISATSNSPFSPDIRQTLGKSIFAMVVGMEFLTISFIAPALTGGAISTERESQTYDLLRTTLLPARSLVMGKLLSALSYIALLLFAALPIQSLAFLFGGVAAEELIISVIMLFVTAIGFCAIGIFFSSFIKRTLASIVVSYTTANLLLFGIPIFIIMLLGFIGGIAYSSLTGVTVFWEIMLYTVGWLLVSINPVTAAILTEIMLIEEQTIFYFMVTLSNGNQIPVLSPWIGFVVFHSIISLILIFLSIRFVKRVER